MIVHLEPWEYQWASHVGIARFTANWQRADAAYYDKARMEDDRTAQVAAAVCELAVAKWMGVYWSGHVWDVRDHHRYRDLADVGNNIEVRRVRSGRGAAIRRRQLGKGLFLAAAEPVAPEFREVNVWGWMHHDEAWEVSEPSHFDKDTRYVAREMFTTVVPGQLVGAITERTHA